MSRHFFGLYLLIVVTLAAVSWGQDKLLQTYGTGDLLDERSQAVALNAVADRLRSVPAREWKDAVARAAAGAGAALELFKTTDIAGPDTLAKLRGGQIAYLRAARGESWALRQIDADTVLALEVFAPDPQRGPLEWALDLFFYAAIGLVIMIWIWPLTRDLGALERAAARFGDKNWQFDLGIKPRSQIYPLAETFRKMASRIDGLIASHKDMSNAVSHEIKTPLSRMQFEIELAQQASSPADVQASLNNIKADIAEINSLVTATLSYAILERADIALNIGVHDFTTLIPAIADYVRRDVRPEIRMHTDVAAAAAHVVCDGHLFETVLKNLLYNAARFAATEVRVSFATEGGENRLLVDDDGPGIPEKDRARVFDSFVQLEMVAGKKRGFGLGLAIVRRAIEWHAGKVSIAASPLGGARIAAVWPEMRMPGA